MDPTQVNPQVMQMLAALQANQSPGGAQAGQAASLGNQPLQPYNQPSQMPGMPAGGMPDAYQAMMNPPPMAASPAPLY